MILLDTSMWTQALRKVGGDPAVRARVEALAEARLAAWCDPVRLELWAGVRDDIERRKLELLTAELPRLPIDNDVWQLACSIASRARAGALTLPANDFLIFACAMHHRVALEHRDQHFGRLAKLLG